MRNFLKKTAVWETSDGRQFEDRNEAFRKELESILEDELPTLGMKPYEVIDFLLTTKKIRVFIGLYELNKPDSEYDS